MCEPSTIAMSALALGSMGYSAVRQKKQQDRMEEQQEQSDKRMQKYRQQQAEQGNEKDPLQLQGGGDKRSGKGMGTKKLTIPLGGTGGKSKTGVNIPG